MDKKDQLSFSQTIRRYRSRLFFIGALLVFTLLFHIFKRNRAVMNFMTDYVAHPVRRLLATLCSFTEYSVAEWLIVAAALFATVFLVVFVVGVVRGFRRLPSVLLRLLSFAAAVVLSISTLMTLLWNVNYYADGFQDKSGIRATESTVDELYLTTKLFVEKLNGESVRMLRGDDGLFQADLGEIFDDSLTIFDNIEAEFPFLSGRALRSKKVLFSRAMSYIKTTGVAFPLTGEANINVDQPLAWIPATIAHEVAHQRKIASEQEANFVAIVACDRSDSRAYRYSGYLLAYNYLASALSRADYDLYAELYSALADSVKRDLTDNYNYWQQFETKVAEVSDSLYDDYLKAQGQELGTKSYGAVVDLLIAYYS